MSLVDRIKILAREKELTIKGIEQCTGLGNGTIRRWDNSPPSADKLLKIAYLLNTTCEYLLTGNEKLSASISNEDAEWLSLIHQLPRDAQIEFKGELKGYFKCYKKMSALADEKENAIKQAK